VEDGVEETLLGLPATADGGPPKKSRPSKEFAGSEGLVDVAVLAGNDRTPGVSVVLGLAGGDGISPNISGLGTFACVPVGGRAVDGLCWEAERSSFAFSWTTFRGTSSSPSSSNVAGSGMGPSIVQRFDSYFVRMKFSIFASDGTCPGASFASQYLLARAFPQFSTLCNCSSVQASRSTDLTRLI
jgi:hypothetical protein